MGNGDRQPTQGGTRFALWVSGSPGSAAGGSCYWSSCSSQSVLRLCSSIPARTRVT